MKVIGIYKITSPSNRIYIGQTVDFIKRSTGRVTDLIKLGYWKNYKIENYATN